MSHDPKRTHGLSEVRRPEITGELMQFLQDINWMRTSLPELAEYHGLRDAEVRERRACLLMIVLGRLEIAGRLSHTGKDIPGAQNTLADGISRWPRSLLANKGRELTNSSDWYEQPIRTRGSGIFAIVLQTTNIRSKHNESLWNIMMNEAEHG